MKTMVYTLGDHAGSSDDAKSDGWASKIGHAVQRLDEHVVHDEYPDPGAESDSITLSVQ